MNAPIIAVNGHYLAQTLTGVQRYAAELLTYLRDEDDVRVIAPPQRLQASRASLHLWEQAVLPLQLPKQSVLWSPTNTGPLAAPKQVLTAHDGAVLSHPEWFSASYVMWRRRLLPALLRRAEHVITVSHFAKDHLCAHIPEIASKITVIYNGIDRERFFRAEDSEQQRVREKYRLSERFILGLGSRDPRKNFAGLLHAWETSEDSLDDAELVIAGGGARSFQQVDFTTHSKRVRLLGYVNDDDLAGLYSAARLFVYPSLFEGFGLPVLEAMACGTPVITANTTSLPEVARDAALLVDPRDHDALAHAVVTLWHNTEEQHRLRERGFERVQAFRWRDSAWDTLQLLRSVR